MENKEWCEPELIVLVRSKPEEAVLDTCKESVAGAGPNGMYYSCDVPDSQIPPGCYGCYSQVGS
jgi:hypothetical protein